jgi:hypothetical protein
MEVSIASAEDCFVEPYLSRNVAVRIEETKGIVCAAVDRDTNFSDIVISVWCCLCPSDWTLVVRVANVELVVVRRVRFQILRFNLLLCQAC